MAIALIMPNRNSAELASEIKKIDNRISVEIWPEIKNPAQIDFAVVWYHPENELLKFPNLKAISSYGAGVDHILSDPGLPKHIPFARIVAKSLVSDMNQYVHAAIINDQRRFSDYRLQQNQKDWHGLNQHRGKHVGIMGLGQLGSALAKYLLTLGFKISGWSRSQQQLAQVNCYSSAQIDQFLCELDYLVCLLPLTNETDSILNQHLFAKCKNQPYLINVARGKHVVDADLIQAIDSGVLSGACLDVFREEPLPENHPFWTYTKITITPHIAAVTKTDEAAEQIAENYGRIKSNRTLLNQVDCEKGY